LYLICCVLFSGCGGRSKNSVSPSTVLTIQGRIVDATNPEEGIQGAEVNISSKAKNGALWSSTTDEKGYYIINNIPEGPLTINVNPGENSYREIKLDLNLTPPVNNLYFNISLIPDNLISEPVTINVGPKNITLKAGTTQLFNCEIRDSQNNILELTPIWIIEGAKGLIYPNGEFTALKEGNCRIIAIIGSKNSASGYIMDSTDVKIIGNIENPDDNDEYPLGVGYYWVYRSDWSLQMDEGPSRGVEYTITKIKSIVEIDGKNCYAVDWGWKEGNANEYTYGLPYYIWKSSEGVFKIGEGSDTGIEKYSEPQKYIVFPIYVGATWKVTEPFEQEYKVTAKEIVNTKIGNFEAWKIEIKVDPMEENDYIRVWITKGIGEVQFEARIGIPLDNNEGESGGTLVWYEIAKIINYSFPKTKGTPQVLFAYPIDEKIKELRRIKKEGIKYLKGRYI
jgi:hypothetical protein